MTISKLLRLSKVKYMMELIGIFVLFSSVSLFYSAGAALCGQFQSDSVEFTLITNASTTPSCNPQSSITAQYRRADDTLNRWTKIDTGIVTVECRSSPCNKTTAAVDQNGISRSYQTMRGYFPADFEVKNGEGIQLRFIQIEHGGGYCNCWGLACDILLINSTNDIVNSITTSCDEDTNRELFQCADSASVERGFVIQFSDDPEPNFNGSGLSGSGLLENDTVDQNGTDSDTECQQPEINIFRAQDQRKDTIQVNDCENQAYVEVKFTYDFEGLDSFDEGLELSFSYLLGEWIPVWFYTAHDDSVRSLVHDSAISLGNITEEGQLMLRGYPVNFTVAENLTDNEAIIWLCGDNVLDEDAEDELFKIRFRWLQTAAQDDSNDTDGDIVRFSNISITVVNGTNEISLFSSLSQNEWNTKRRIHFDTGGSVVFSDSTNNFAVPITSREISTVCLGGITQIHFTLIGATSQACYFNSTFPLPFRYPQLQYRGTHWNSLEYRSSSQMNTIKVDNQTGTEFRVETFVVDLKPHMFSSCSNESKIRFIQMEHRGGFCGCWTVASLTVILGSGQTKTLRKECGHNIDLGEALCLDRNNDELSSLDRVAGFCGDSASIPREFVSRLERESDGTNNVDSRSCSINDVKNILNNVCSESRLRVEVSFDLQFKADVCDEIDDFSEGVEFAVREQSSANDDWEWIPLWFISSVPNVINQSFIELPDEETVSDTGSTFNLRGYRVPYIIHSHEDTSYNVSICGDILSRNNLKLQFRWLHTSYHEHRDSLETDVVIIDNVKVVARNCTDSVTLLEDNFESQESLNYTKWDSDLTYNVKLLSHTDDNNNCTPSSGGSVFFYPQQLTPVNFCGNNNYTITSRQLVTGLIDDTLPSECESQLIPNDMSTDSPTTESITTTIMNKDNDNNDAEMLRNLKGFFESVGDSDVDLTSAVNSFSSILRSFDDDFEFEPIDSKLILSNVSQWLDMARENFMNGKSVPSDYIAGSNLLYVMEDFALNHHRVLNLTADNIVLRFEEMLINNTDERISLIGDEVAGISVPGEVFMGQGIGVRVRMASFLYRNLSGLLPERLGGFDSVKFDERDQDQTVFRLASPVISASLQCDNCTIKNLSNPVEVTFTHLPYDKDLLNNDSNASVTCVFWEFGIGDGGGPRWSPEGCETNFTSTSTVCKCNHLTHFAILLSARPLVLSRSKTLALQITGYIGVSISLVAMAVTILVFICLKPLRTMRNYIHIQLCVSLGIAQIIFVAGIEPRLGEGQLVGGVPVGCRLVAVLLHYWFLVSFMWMLMEGVVLYVALVRVFIKYHARYIIAFTITSYGLPLLYVGALTVPLGFVRTEDYRQNDTLDYGYEQVCYLNPKTSFIWSIIAPVILIFLANICFFIMAIVIMYRHQKRQYTESKMEKVKQWLKSSISLTVVMGITWIIGFLVVEVDELFALAYIFTIFVAFQGLFIFVIFVLLSKQVRENYIKWWKAKVAESDFLSKHFGTKDLYIGTDLSSQRKQKEIDSVAKSSSGMVSKEMHQSEAHEFKTPYSDYVQGTQSYSETNGIENDKGPLTTLSQLKDTSSFTVTYIPTPVMLDMSADTISSST